jgi:hypothetical protein
MFSAQAVDLEHALWVALRTLKDRAALCHLLAERATARGQEGVARRFREQAATTEERAALVRRAIEQGAAGGWPDLVGARREEAAMTAERERLEPTPSPAAPMGQH